LWPEDSSFYGPFDRQRWPRTQVETVEKVDEFRFETTLSDDKMPALQMQWVVVIEANGGYSLRVEWNPR
jgi:hypothetical protein